MAKFEKTFEELKKKTAEGSSVYSRTDLVNLTGALINDPEYKYDAYSKSGTGYEKEERYPVKDFREAIKKTVKKEFGIDAAELAKLDTAELPKEMAQSVTELGGLSIKKYLETGKSYRFPMTSEKEATMSLSLAEAEEVTKATNKITEVAPGKYESVPTGKTVKTSAHTRMVAKNAVPGWLKEDVTK